MFQYQHLKHPFKQRRQIRDPKALTFVITTSQCAVSDALESSSYASYHRYVEDTTQELVALQAIKSGASTVRLWRGSKAESMTGTR